MSNKLVIIVYPFPAVGHMNACIGFAEALRRRGHKIIFIIDPPFKGQLVRYDFEEEVLNDSDTKSEYSMPGEQGAIVLENSGILAPLSSIDKLRLIIKSDLVKKIFNGLLVNERQLKSIINKYNPDAILLDHSMVSPSLIYSGKPWIKIVSTNPLIIEDERTPPFESGYPTNGDKNDWFEFKELSEKRFSSVEYNKYLKANCYPISADNRGITFSPFLNIYNYPKELDYTDIRPLPDKWFAVDSLVRKGEVVFELPMQLREGNGKLIYLSMGSMGSVDIELMKRLVNILSKSKHKFIVSKGLFGDKYELADNMWGQRSVPQTKVLPLVDLVLTHGGNNSVTETLYFGKPMIVLPLFMDQFDNAQRVHEKGFGIRLDPYLCSEEVLLTSIEVLLNNKVLKKRLSLVSKRIQNSDSLERAVDKIETLVI